MRVSRGVRSVFLANLRETGVLTRAMFVLTLAVVLASCSRNDSPVESKQGATAKPSLTVTMTQARSEDWPQVLNANGSITAWQEASVGAEVGGLRIAELLVNVGDTVRHRQVLARLAAASVEVELAQLRASIAEAEATLADAHANAERARQLERTGAISAQQIDQLLTAERTAIARLDVARARLRAEQIRLDNTSVLAPDDGIISARAGMIGAVVQPGQELFRLIRKGRLEWRAEVIASELTRIKPGQRVEIEAANGAKIVGTVRVVAPTVDAQTRTAIVYVDLPSGTTAKAGMFARGEFSLGTGTAVTLPQAALSRRDGFDYVFLLQPDARVRAFKIELGRRRDDRIEVVTPLPADARVIAGGVGFLNDGDLVRVGEGTAR
jgi:HlyD family secretion protein